MTQADPTVPVDAPILRFGDWRHLLRWLYGDLDRRLAKVPRKEPTARLVTVATLARWIARQGVVPGRAGRLHVAIGDGPREYPMGAYPLAPVVVRAGRWIRAR